MWLPLFGKTYDIYGWIIQMVHNYLWMWGISQALFMDGLSQMMIFNGYVQPVGVSLLSGNSEGPTQKHGISAGANGFIHPSACNPLQYYRLVFFWIGKSASIGHIWK